MRSLYYSLFILFAAFVVVVALANAHERTAVTLWPDAPGYSWPEVSLAWVIFFSAAAGSVFMGVVAVLEGSKTRVSNARLRARVRQLEVEVETLRRRGTPTPDRDEGFPGPVPSADLEDDTERV